MGIEVSWAVVQCLGVVGHRLPQLAIRVLLEVEHMLEFPVEGSIAVCQVVEEDTMVVAQEAFEVVLMEMEVASILRAVEEEHILVVEELASSW